MVRELGGQEAGYWMLDGGCWKAWMLDGRSAQGIRL